MFTLIANNWRLYVLRGILAVFFGLMALFWPGLTLDLLILVFGFYAILEGILAIITAFLRRERSSYWWLLFLEGLTGMAIGVFALLWPALTAIVLLVFIAAWALLTGSIEIAAAVQLRKQIKGEWLLGTSGILSILIGLILLVNPSSGALALVWVIGLYAVLFGSLMVILGVKVKNRSALSV